MQRLTTTQHAPFAAPANRGNTALQVAPFAATYNHAACSLCCACQPWQYRTANRTASGSLYAARGSLYAAPANRGNTALHANRTASDFQRQCCCLASGSLYAARGSLYAAPANRGNTALHANRTASDFQRQCCCLASGSLYAARSCCACRELPFFLPAESAEKEPCLLTDPALYTAAAWPRLYCRLTGPVQPITARRLLASAAAAQPIRPLLLCTCKQLERYSRSTVCCLSFWSVW
jgi:hypothetical protein